MSRREAWLSAGLVFGVALAVRLWAASWIVFARPEDAAYYVGVARNLVEGRGLISDAIWSFQTPPLTFPRPAFEVWLPLPSFLCAIPMLVIGPTLWAAQLASATISAIVAVLTWRLALDASSTVRGRASAARTRSISLGAGMTAAVFLPLVLAGVEPDSTAVFAALALGSCLLIARLSRAADPPATGHASDAHANDGRGTPVRSSGPDLAVLGLLLGLAALTRNEAIWLALTWAIVAWRIAGRTGSRSAGPSRLATWARLVGIPAAIALAVFAPWAIRDWLTFGTPIPGQAIANALSLQGSDIFAWQDRPTLDRYLAAGPETLLQLRVTGFTHNLVDVLLLLGTPVAAIGLVALPRSLRLAPSLRPLAAFGAITFIATTVLFPVATTWGTFLHAAGAVEVLLVVSAVLGLDELLEWVRTKRAWEGNVAWLGPTLTIAAAGLLTAVLLPIDGAASRATQAKFEALPQALADAGAPLDAEGPVITDNPIWFAESTGHEALALPDEDASSVLDLAEHLGATLLVVSTENGGRWPEAAEDPTDLASTCFTPLPMTHLGDDPDAAPGVTVYAIRCP
jgi:hypothetical protein